MADGTWTSRKRAAAHFGFSESTIDRLCAAGELEAVRFGGAVRILAASIEAYEQRQRKEAAAARRAGEHLRAQQRKRIDPYASDAFPIPGVDDAPGGRRAA